MSDNRQFFPRQVIEAGGNRWDWALLPLALALLILLAYAAEQMARPYQVGEVLPLTLDPVYLPYYLLRTTLRMFIALGASILFSCAFAAITTKSRAAEKVLVPLLDILQSIPILGFLGTVLGITGAIAGVTPEKLEHDLSKVTDGLSLAFDATALALGLTMIIMFLSFLVDRANYEPAGRAVFLKVRTFCRNRSFVTTYQRTLQFGPHRRMGKRTVASNNGLSRDTATQERRRANGITSSARRSRDCNRKNQPSRVAA